SWARSILVLESASATRSRSRSAFARSRLAFAVSSCVCSSAGSSRATTCPLWTIELKSAPSHDTLPDTCVPTCTVVTAWSVPVAPPVVASAAGCDCVHAAAGRRHGLHRLEVHERSAIVQDRAQLVVRGVREIALRLHDLEVGRHPDLELALRRLELLLRQLARDAAGLHALERALNGERRIGDVGRNLKLKRF